MLRFRIKRFLKRHLQRLLTPVFSAMGYHLIPRHFYQQIPESEDLDETFFQAKSEMKGLDIDEKAIRDFVTKRVSPFLNEFKEQFPINQQTKEAGFYLLNGSFMAVDAQIYYALIRALKPQRIIEIGGGYSSQVALAACRKNTPSELLCNYLKVIEPYPSSRLSQLHKDIEIIEKKVQHVAFDVFESLQAGDILFIDSSHVLRAGGDVQYEYLEILPRLNPGVYVHVHDISLPKPYPKVYSEQKLYWNEQYLLQAFLAFNTRFKIIWPGNYMMVNYPEEVLSTFPEITDMRQLYPYAEPTSFWMQSTMNKNETRN